MSMRSLEDRIRAAIAETGRPLCISALMVEPWMLHYRRLDIEQTADDMVSRGQLRKCQTLWRNRPRLGYALREEVGSGR
jgi:hypothetical protein